MNQNKIINNIEKMDKAILKKINNITDKDGRTLLYLASQKGKIKAVQLLLEAGSNVNITNESGTTAFDECSMEWL